MATEIQNKRVQWVALHMANVLRDWPEMTFDEAAALSRNMGWAYRGYRQALSDEAAAGPQWRGRISKQDLRSAWMLAKDIVREG